MEPTIITNINDSYKVYMKRDNFKGIEIATNEKPIKVVISELGMCCEEWGSFIEYFIINNTDDIKNDSTYKMISDDEKWYYYKHYFENSEILDIVLDESNDDNIEAVKKKNKIQSGDIFGNSYLTLSIYTTGGKIIIGVYNMHNGYYPHNYYYEYEYNKDGEVIAKKDYDEL